MNSTPAASKARRPLASFAAVIEVSSSVSSARGLGGECRALHQQECSPILCVLHSTFSPSLRPLFLDLQSDLDHPPDCFRPRWLIGLLLSPFVDAGCECWRRT